MLSQFPIAISYRNFRHGLGVSRRTWWGGYLAAGYRLGRGDFQPWYKERETNEGGEFKVALGIPLLQGRAIDPRRVAVFQASLGRQAVEPQIQREILISALEASAYYWKWVAEGNKLQIQRALVELAAKRQKQFQAGQEAGRFAEVDVFLNNQLLAEHRNKMLEVEQKFRQAGFKLSLYLRDEFGNPRLPPESWLPEHFPRTYQLDPLDVDSEMALAASRRPEINLLQLSLQSQQIDQRLARDQLLPTIDLYTEGSQDVGTPASSSNDKGQFQLAAGLQGSLPIQRRKARGKIQSTASKIAQINQELRLQRNKIGVEIQEADNAIRFAAQQLEQSKQAVEYAITTLRSYQYAYNKGYEDLLYLNIVETKAFETEVKLVEAQSDWFFALSQLQAALALDPLAEAMEITDLPPADYPGPDDMRKDVDQVPADFEADWEKHLQRGKAQDNNDQQ
ncbi:MAG: TolC family protein [Planctomycetota bacterium]|nr:TolC family protein [Planctomycetota bacterium]